MATLLEQLVPNVPKDSIWRVDGRELRVAHMAPRMGFSRSAGPGVRLVCYVAGTKRRVTIRLPHLLAGERIA